MVDSKDKSTDPENEKRAGDKDSLSEEVSTILPDIQNPNISSFSHQDHPGMIGEYQIIRKIGSGGMSIVYEAKQKHPKRLVALKVIQGGRFLDEHIIKLFEREAQALARLNHPGIAAIYESGCTPDGQSFFTMELVRGETLKEYLERTGKDELITPDQLLERLAIFRKISDAVTYAHQRGVIHRDLKPSNIIVQREYEPSDTMSEPSSPDIKILDFGLARITEVDIAVATIGTEVGMIQGTLPYMSPEQIRGNPDEIDVRSDVYSLGVIMYEMVAGQKPYDVHQAMIHEAARIICETPPAPISKTWRGTKRLNRDLETIVLKALEKPTARRYQSVSAMGEDISRFLSGQPINARPPSTAYQLRKLAQRHKIGFGFIASMAVLIIAFAILMSIQAEKIALERDRANHEAQTAQKVTEFLVSLFETSDPFYGKGRDVTVGEILDNGAARIRTELQNQPKIQAEISYTIGDVYGNLGMYDKAIELVQAGLEIREREFGHESLEVAESMDTLGLLKMAKGDFSNAEQLLREAYEIRRKIIDTDHILIALSLNNIGILQYYKGELEKSEELFRQALAIHRRATGKTDLRTADYMNNLAMALKKQEKYSDATPFYQEALSIRRKELGPKHPLVAQSNNNLGMLYLRVKNYSAAEKLFQEALSINRKNLGAGHPEVAANLNNLALLNSKIEKYDKAEDLYRQVIVLDRKNLGENNPNLAQPIQSLGVVLTHKKEFQEAEENLRKALSLKLLQFDKNHWEIATTSNLLGGNLVQQGRSKEAEPILIESYSIIKNQFGANHDRTQVAGKKVIECYEALGKNDKAMEIRAELDLSK